MSYELKTGEINVGVVGLGLMGSSIVVALLIAGHKVKGIAPISEDQEIAPARIKDQLEHCQKSGLLEYPAETYWSNLTISENYKQLGDCSLVIECVIEKDHIKEHVYQKITANVDEQVIIASNTSAIPISTLQKYIINPKRFLGIHWAEPAYATRFLEITCGKQTDPKKAQWVFNLAHLWGKEPTLLKKDIRGFITNRLMYSVYREGLSMVENGEATLEDIDKSFRYDEGSWITLMGIFRRMDMMGLKNYLEIFKRIFPKLSNTGEVPLLMQKMLEINAKGIQNSKGLYSYKDCEAKEWEEAFFLFNKDIYLLADEYSQNNAEILK